MEERLGDFNQFKDIPQVMETAIKNIHDLQTELESKKEFQNLAARLDAALAQLHDANRKSLAEISKERSDRVALSKEDAI